MEAAVQERLRGRPRTTFLGHEIKADHKPHEVIEAYNRGAKWIMEIVYGCKCTSKTDMKIFNNWQEHFLGNDTPFIAIQRADGKCSIYRIRP